MELPAPFEEEMKALLGPEFQGWMKAMDEPPPVSIRYNMAKRGPAPEQSDRVPWEPSGVYLPERPVFTLDPLFHAGAYYVQEASSMFIGEAVRQLFDPRHSLKVLDLCAAPGGKSTLLAGAISRESLLLANEVIKSRYHILSYNLIKWGLPNAHCSNHDSRDFSFLKDFFDLVLVDAPCSGEGLFRKDALAVGEWSPDQVEMCASRQKRILGDAAALVRPGGFLIYSTCTYNETENTANAHWLSRQAGLDYHPLQIPQTWKITEREYGYQFYPHRLRGEGFYLSCFRKPGREPAARGISASYSLHNWAKVGRQALNVLEQWVDTSACGMVFFQDKQGQVRAVPATQLNEVLFLSRGLYRFRFGFEVGTFKGKDFVPSPELALSTCLAAGIPAIDLDRDQALLFLKKEDPGLSIPPTGWALARFDGLGLGWIKGLKNRVNNYYPREWRILMDLNKARDNQA